MAKMKKGMKMKGGYGGMRKKSRNASSMGMVKGKRK